MAGEGKREGSGRKVREEGVNEGRKEKTGKLSERRKSTEWKRRWKGRTKNKGSQRLGNESQRKKGEKEENLKK